MSSIIPEVCPSCCTLKSIMVKEDRLECSRCGATLLITKDEFKEIEKEFNEE